MQQNIKYHFRHKSEIMQMPQIKNKHQESHDFKLAGWVNYNLWTITKPLYLEHRDKPAYFVSLMEKLVSQLYEFWIM